jgi:hypothetical protein
MSTSIENVFLEFWNPQMSAKRRAQRLPASQWANHRQTIRDLYIHQGKTLEQVVEIMKQAHDFHATYDLILLDQVDMLTATPCSSPRQFTQKFRSWKLHKYERRNGEHKPRRTSSIYQNGHVALGKQRSLASVAVTSSHYAAFDFEEIEEIGYYDGDSHADVGTKRQDSAILNPALDKVGATSSSATMLDDSDDEISDNDGASPLVEQSLGAAASTVPTAYAGASSVRPGWNSLYGPDIPWLELDGETFRHLDGPRKKQNQRQELRMRVKEQAKVALAIWQLWYAGVLNEFESHQARGLDRPAPPLVKLDLESWICLYPRDAGGRTGVNFSLPLLPGSDDPNLTWEVYANYGHSVAVTKEWTTLRAQEYYSRLARRLTALVMLAPGGGIDLRECFTSILNCFESVLQDQYGDLEQPCERFAKQLLHGLSESEERYIGGNGIQASSAAILAMICHREIQKPEPSRFSSHLPSDLELLLDRDTEFSIKRAFVWAARFALYYASPELEKSPLPTHLCARALNGCRRILEIVKSRQDQESYGPITRGGEFSLSNMLQEWSFASVWAEWICGDSSFFLDHSPHPVLQP